MRKITEGKKMFLVVMTIFLIYVVSFIIFEYSDSTFFNFDKSGDWHLLLFSFIGLLAMAIVMMRYAKRMDQRISHEQAEKENQMRRELTQNIAHELKTPVASILGYTETILDNPEMDAETKSQFIDRTHIQAQRLTALLQDISTLNRMDYARDMLKMESVNISQLVADIAQETALACEHKQMVFRNCIPSGIIINGNPSLLYSVFRNLVDNSINHAGEGSTIVLDAKSEDSYWRFNYSDDGVGIAEEHLPRIFERFYRIDKGRSRSLGGTGLGLAIVKNAILIHGGSIVAQSSVKGLAFEFTLKK